MTLLAFRLLRTNEIHVNSYGAVERAVSAPPASWEAALGTLYDPRIFGAAEDWRCACGRLAGKDHGRVICPDCGVMIGCAAKLRRTRCGHISLPMQVPHPLQPDVLIDTVAVLPIAYRGGAPGGDNLNTFYTEVLRAVAHCGAGSAEQPALDDLQASVAALMCNEWQARPREYQGRPIQSLLGHLSADYCTSESVAAYLLALGVTVSVEPPQAAQP